MLISLYFNGSVVDVRDTMMIGHSSICKCANVYVC